MPKKVVYLVVEVERTNEHDGESPDFCIINLTQEVIAILEAKCAMTRAMQACDHTYQYGPYDCPSDYVRWVMDTNDYSLTKVFNECGANDYILAIEGELPEVENCNQAVPDSIHAYDKWFRFHANSEFDNGTYWTGELQLQVLAEAAALIRRMEN